MYGRLGTDLNHAFGQLSGYLSNLETTATTKFGAIITALDNKASGNSSGVGDSPQPLSRATGGATTHTVMTVAPQSNPNQPQNAAVQGMWGMHTVRTNANNVTQPSSLRASQAGDAIGQSFMNTLTNNPGMQAALSQLGNQFGGSIHIKSASALFDMLIADLLALAETAIVGGITFMQAVVSGLQTVVDQFVALLDGGGELYIPIISEIWDKLSSVLGLPKITLIDVVTLVAAIPVAIVYKVVTGHWLSQDIATLNAAGVQEGTPPQWVVNANGIIQAMIQVVGGVFSCVNDTITIMSEGEKSLLNQTWGPLFAYCLLGAQATGPIYNAATNDTDASYWTVLGLNMINVALNVVSNKNLGGPELSPIWTAVGWLFAIGTLVAQYEGDVATGQSELAIIADALANIPGVVSIVKLIPDPEAIIPFAAPISDVGCNLAAAGITLFNTIEGWDKPAAVQAYRHHLPIVMR